MNNRCAIFKSVVMTEVNELVASPVVILADREHLSVKLILEPVDIGALIALLNSTSAPRFVLLVMLLVSALAGVRPSSQRLADGGCFLALVNLKGHLVELGGDNQASLGLPCPLDLVGKFPGSFAQRILT